jgi:regulator of sirC expression with transglutaminase-like and TPR domain
MELDAALTVLAHDPAAPLDLAELSLQLARDEYAALDVTGYLSELDAMAHEARRRLHGGLPARVAGLCRYLFHDLGFHGNQNDYYDARNSYLNEVLDRRMGLPITLSVVAMSVGARAGLQVVGVGLPGHFVAKAIDGQEPPGEIIFDPFHGGRVRTPEECEALVERVVGTPFAATREALEPVSLGLIVQRMLNNLKAVYLGGGDFGRAIRVMGRLRQVSPNDPVQQRDLGAALVRHGQPGPAIEHLEAYLNAVPQAEDAELVRQVLNRARAAVARWN